MKFTNVKKLLVDKENRIHIFLKLPLFLLVVNFLLRNFMFNFLNYSVKTFLQIRTGGYIPLSLIRKLISQSTLLYLFYEIVLILIIYIFAVYIDKFSIKELGLNFKISKFKNILYGILAALFSIGGYVLILYLKGDLIIESVATEGKIWNYLFIYLLVLFTVAVQEEILTRSYLLNNLENKSLIYLLGAMSTIVVLLEFIKEFDYQILYYLFIPIIIYLISLICKKRVYNKYFPVIISAFAFAFLHQNNSGIDLISYINIFLAGFLWGYYFIETKDLYFPISMHLAWNYIMGPIFNLNVSGLKFKGLIRTRVINENIYSGFSFGPESSIIITFFLLILILIYFLKFKKSKNKKIANS